MDNNDKVTYRVPDSRRIAEAIVGRYAREISELLAKPKLTAEDLRRLPELREFARMHKLLMTK